MLPALLLAACSHSDEPSPKTEPSTPRTVLVYMVAENNLSYNSTKDIVEMTEAAKAGHFGDSRLMIYQDYTSGDPTLYEMTADGVLHEIKVYDNTTLSVDTRRLRQVIADSRKQAPAKRYGIIFWGHGTGYVEDGIKPQSYGGEKVDGITYWMNNADMASALAGQGFDWIYFDCCFMASVETAYELRRSTDYIVGSATELPGDGMPYDKTLRYLMPYDSDLTGAARSTFDHYDAKTLSSRTCTMSVIRTAGLDRLAQTMRRVFTTTRGLPEGYVPQAFQTDDDRRRYSWEYYDLLHYAEALAADDTALAAELKAAFDNVVIAAHATPKLWNTVSLANHHGLGTLIIESPDSPLLDKFNYRSLAWWTDVVAPRFNRP